MKVCDLVFSLREMFEPVAKEHGLEFSIAQNPLEPYTRILNAGSRGLMILCYQGGGRLDDRPHGRLPVESRFELYVSQPTGLSADRAGGVQFRDRSGSRAPLYSVVEEVEALIASAPIPEIDAIVEDHARYDRTDPAMMPDGNILSAYRVSFSVRRALN